jgi:hypothetical protein
MAFPSAAHRNVLLEPFQLPGIVQVQANILRPAAACHELVSKSRAGQRACQFCLHICLHPHARSRFSSRYSTPYAQIPSRISSTNVNVRAHSPTLVRMSSMRSRGRLPRSSAPKRRFFSECMLPVVPQWLETDRLDVYSQTTTYCPHISSVDIIPKAEHGVSITDRD